MIAEDERWFAERHTELRQMRNIHDGGTHE